MASTRALTGWLLLVLGIIVVVIPRSESLSCTPCNSSKCKKPQGCQHGYAKDICYCCERCAKGRGEECGGDWGEVGACAEGLTCLIKKGTRRGRCGHRAVSGTY